MIPECNNLTGCVCEHNVQVNYNTCKCDTYLDPHHFCNTTIFEAYQDFDIIYPIFGLLIFLVLMGIYGFEFVNDLKRRRFSFPLVTKGTVMMFILSRLILFPLWIASSTMRTTNYAVAVTFINSIGIIILIVSISLLIISWLDLILVARNLGSKDHRLRSIKYALFSLAFIIGTSNIIALIIVQIVPDLTVILAVTLFLLIVLVIVTIIISVIYLVIILRWLQKTPKSVVFNITRKKSYWIVALLSSLLLDCVVLGITSLFSHDTPIEFLSIEITYRILEIIMLTLMFFFLERKFVMTIKNHRLE